MNATFGSNDEMETTKKCRISGFHSADCQKLDITTCSPVKVNRRFVALLTTQFHPGFLLGLFFTPKMKFRCFLKTSVDFQWTTRCHPRRQNPSSKRGIVGLIPDCRDLQRTCHHNSTLLLTQWCHLSIRLKPCNRRDITMHNVIFWQTALMMYGVVNRGNTFNAYHNFLYWAKHGMDL
jgi:hypothetical protein